MSEPDDDDPAAAAVFFAAERVRRRNASLRKAVIPIVAAIALLAVWQVYVKTRHVPMYILPAPTDVLASLVADWPILSAALWITLEITFAALFTALIGGVLVSILFAE